MCVRERGEGEMEMEGVGIWQVRASVEEGLPPGTQNELCLSVWPRIGIYPKMLHSESGYHGVNAYSGSLRCDSI